MSNSQGHRDYQRRYFSEPRRTRPRMAPVRTPYVERHFAETLAALRPPPGGRILELGCGMGRFSLPLAERGYQVTGLDLSPELLGALGGADPAAAVTTVCGSSADADRLVDGPFDAVVGFFFLHHLPDLAPTFAAAARLLVAGGRVAFCEPNGWNPSFYVQIAFTPGMSFRGDGGVVRMRRGHVLPRLAGAGFADLACRRYGLFPPALANRPSWRRFERRLEHSMPAAWRAFQVFSARLPPRDAG